MADNCGAEGFLVTETESGVNKLHSSNDVIS